MTADADLIIGQRASAPEQGGGSTGAASIIDGTQDTFMEDVIEASRHVPVLVDFWATWCGPCKTLTPTLEKVTRAAAGRVRLVKIDVDRNQALVAQLSQLGVPLQSVPTVAAFWQGQIADLFSGALPESGVKRFIEGVLKQAGAAFPSADLLGEAKTAFEAGQYDVAGGLFSAALEQDPETPAAWGGLVRTLVALEDDEAAAEALSQVPPKLSTHAEIEAARNALALAIEGRAARDALSELEARIEASPDDLQVRYDLATALNASDRREEAAEALLIIIKRDRSWNEDAARLQLLRFFDAWGASDPATLKWRRKLSTLLFS